MGNYYKHVTYFGELPSITCHLNIIKISGLRCSCVKWWNVTSYKWIRLVHAIRGFWPRNRRFVVIVLTLLIITFVCSKSFLYLCKMIIAFARHKTTQKSMNVKSCLCTYFVSFTKYIFTWFESSWMDSLINCMIKIKCQMKSK